MTYEQFLDLERSKALAIIKEERRRFRAAQELFDVYAAGMADLQLQSLTWGDIGGRLTELGIAERELDEDYSDTELNRARFANAQTDTIAPDNAGLVSGGGTGEQLNLPADNLELKSADETERERAR